VPGRTGIASLEGSAKHNRHQKPGKGRKAEKGGMEEVGPKDFVLARSTPY